MAIGETRVVALVVQWVETDVGVKRVQKIAVGAAAAAVVLAYVQSSRWRRGSLSCCPCAAMRRAMQLEEEMLGAQSRIGRVAAGIAVAEVLLQ